MKGGRGLVILCGRVYHVYMKKYMKKFVKLGLLFSIVFLLSCAYDADATDTTAGRSCAEKPGRAQMAVSRHFEDIRDNEAKLQYFFQQMPKGGDLHNHLTGSVYAETYFDIAMREGLWLDTETFVLYGQAQSPSCVQLQPGMENEQYLRMRAIDQWSIRNFDTYDHQLPQDEFFFGTWSSFGAASYQDMAELLTKLKIRAAAEHVQYLEIMATSPRIDGDWISRHDAENEQMISLIARRDKDGFAAILSSLFADWEDDPAMQGAVTAYADIISDLHEATATVAPDVSTYYQAYASRNVKDPIRVFAQLYVGFKAAAGHENLVAVNIVQAENGIYSMRDYWGHMRMFAFLKAEYAPVRTSMHAGELHLGLVPPEQLKSHIHEAVAVAGADRIGHGVSIAFEGNAPELLAQMAREGIPVEINLTSNEFILGVKDGEHPLLLYHAHGVPIVLSTDDAGILRTNLSQQFVIAALRYPELKYGDFKRFALDSIHYSFMPEEQKESELLKLNQSFTIFEESFAP